MNQQPALQPFAGNAVEIETLIAAVLHAVATNRPDHRAPAFQTEKQMFERTPPSRAVLRANQAFKPVQHELTEYEQAQKALHDNLERLKAERLAREAADRDGSRRPLG